MICAGLDLKYWPDVKESIESALVSDGGRISSADIFEALQARKMQMWGIHDGILRAVMITEIVNYPQVRALRVLSLSGVEMDTWLDLLLETLEKFGKENEAGIIEFVGRMGWKKVLSDKGWINPQLVMMRKI